MINIILYAQKNVHFLCLEPRETDKCPEIVLKFSKKNLVLKFHFLLLGALYWVHGICLTIVAVIKVMMLACRC